MNFQNKNVTVMGLGHFGGGLGVTKWLLAQGAKVLLTDIASENELELQLAELGTHPSLKTVLGEHRIEDFKNADVVVVNPAVPKPWENIYLRVAWDANVKVTTEIELLVGQLDRKRVIGVTGSCGKSTTAAMIHAALIESGITSHLGGNIGGSLLNKIDTISPKDVVVLELSSAMLWWLNKSGGWSPSVGVITNIEPNHIDWHGSFEEYKKCKELLFKHQKEGEISLRQDPLATFDGLKVLGKHNEQNASVALSAAIAMGANSDRARSGIENFNGLQHRLQFVCDGVYNDSKSTIPSATKLAVDSFENPSKLHLIVGGYDKKNDLSLLAEQAKRVSCLYAIGETKDSIFNLARKNVFCFESLDEAIIDASKRMVEGDVLLLSPGCASWDQFDNYEQRGEVFCKVATEVVRNQQVR